MSFRIHIQIQAEGESFAVEVSDDAPVVRDAAARIVVNKTRLAEGWQRASRDANAWMAARDPQVGAS